MIKKYLPYIKPYKKQVLSTVVLIALEVALGVYIPFLMGKIIDVGIPSGQISVVLHYGVMMVIMAALALACGAAAARTSSVASMGFGSKIREALFQKILGFSFANTDHFGTSSLVMRLTTDVSNTQQAFMMIIRICVRAPLSLICATLMAARINSALVAVFFVAIPLLFLIIVLLAKLGYPHFMSMLKIYDGLNGSVQENLIGIRVVKSFVRENHEKEKFARMNDALKDASIRAEKLIILSMPLFQLMAYACIVAVLWFGGKFVIRSEMLSGELLSFVSYTTQIMMSLMMLSMVFVMIVISKASMQRIVSVLDETIDITDESADAGLKVQDGSVEFKNVCFKYNKDANDYVLSDVNLKIASGETVGIIGGTGSAKTTLAQLIPRLYDVSEGRVLVGGADVKSYKLNNLNDAVGMVLQKNILFSGTIRENLKWGNENATDEEITAACKTAQAHDFIMSFPDGYDTCLGQGGVNVSGGQKQRLCIARALLKQPKILILDDSTSAVDTATEEKIKQAFEHDFAHLTRIIIAQRIHSVLDADKIIVIDDGKIDAVGTHEELLKKNTIYREVYESQQKGVGE